MQKFNFIQVSPQLLIEEKFLDLLKRTNFLDKILQGGVLEASFPLTFSHKKAYREIKAYRVEDREIYLKKYLKNFSEAYQEWENIKLLWYKGICTSIPVLFYKNSSYLLIGTEKIKGVSFITILELETSLIPELITKIARFLAEFHKKKFIHQDCYLNHFYWEKSKDELYIIDVSRVKYMPFLFGYYQIKDLAQLKYSFYEYLKDSWLNLWTLFLETYQIHLNQNLSLFQRLLLGLKFKRIKAHTHKLIHRKFSTLFLP